MEKLFNYSFFGKVRYRQGIEIQHGIHELCRQGLLGPTFLVLEHFPVITVGNRGMTDNILCSEESLKAEGVDLYFSDRGGDVTCHMPGQLVIYPILPLEDLGFSVRDYVAVLETALLELLQTFEVTGQLVEGQPGVWVGAKKIASVGIRLKERVTLHGLALNLKNSLGLFQKIVPCGIKGCLMTSLAEETQKDFTLEEVGQQLIKLLAQKLGGELSQEALSQDVIDQVFTQKDDSGFIYGNRKRNYSEDRQRI